jgi:hypothetical protein
MPGPGAGLAGIIINLPLGVAVFVDDLNRIF